VRIAWPEFAARTSNLYPPAVPANQIPRASLVAELISEFGVDSGLIIQRALPKATPGELCKGTQKRLGAAVYRQAPRLETKAVSVCDTTNTTRCLVAVRGCGSEEVRFTWVAPQRWQGTIWFSTGFVGTDRISLTPLDDGTAEVTIPLVPRGNAGYESQIQQNCGVMRLAGTPVRRGGGSLAPLGLLLLLLVWRRVKPRAGGRR
jgi:hypothetical protein